MRQVHGPGERQLWPPGGSAPRRPDTSKYVRASPRSAALSVTALRNFSSAALTRWLRQHAWLKTARRLLRGGRPTRHGPPASNPRLPTPLMSYKSSSHSFHLELRERLPTAPLPQLQGSARKRLLVTFDGVLFG